MLAAAAAAVDQVDLLGQEDQEEELLETDLDSHHLHVMQLLQLEVVEGDRDKTLGDQL